jgi:DNA uptake protein ComE-like DNA-binding protein
MATPSEKKALIFVAVVALLGSGVRLWRLQHPPAPAKSTHASSTQDDDQPQDRPSSHGRSPKPRGKPHKNSRSGTVQPHDSASIIDLDRASLHDIEALGVLKPGLARLIIADRDTFGPFGSFHELERVPYLTSQIFAPSPLG